MIIKTCNDSNGLAHKMLSHIMTIIPLIFNTAFPRPAGEEMPLIMSVFLIKD
jgi:hypothetical protein